MKIVVCERDQIVSKSVYRIDEKTGAVNIALDVAGFIPGIGEAADALNAYLYAKDGDYLFAAFSLISMIPEVGDVVGKGGKVATWLAKSAPKGVKVAKDLAPKARKAVKGLQQLIISNKQTIDKILDEAGENEKLAPYVPDIKEALNAFIGSRGRAQATKNVARAATKGAAAQKGESIMRIKMNDLRKVIKEEVERSHLVSTDADLQGMSDNELNKRYQKARKELKHAFADERDAFQALRPTIQDMISRTSDAIFDVDPAIMSKELRDYFDATKDRIELENMIEASEREIKRRKKTSRGSSSPESPQDKQRRAVYGGDPSRGYGLGT